jgi:hypothetical protein
MTTTFKRRVSVIQRKWSDNPRCTFAVTDPDGGLFEVTASADVDDLWLEFARDLHSTPDRLRAEGWRIWPCAVEWQETDD